MRRRDEQQQVDQTGGARGAHARLRWLRLRWLRLRWLRLRLRRADALREALDGAQQVVGHVEVRQVRLCQTLEHLGARVT